MTTQDGLDFLGFSVFFSMGLILIGLAVAIVASIIAHAVGDRKERRG